MPLTTCTKPWNCLLSAAAVLLLGGLPIVGKAATIERAYQQNAASVCQGALPAFAGTLRARPLGVGNEGGSPAFLTCSFTRAGRYNDPVNRISLHFTNQSSGLVTISCTGVFGNQRSSAPPDPIYIPKSIVVYPGSAGNLSWTAADNGGEALTGPANTSCSLPPGAVMLDTFNYFNVEIGD